MLFLLLDQRFLNKRVGTEEPHKPLVALMEKRKHGAQHLRSVKSKFTDVRLIAAAEQKLSFFGTGIE